MKLGPIWTCHRTFGRSPCATFQTCLAVACRPSLLALHNQSISDIFPIPIPPLKDVKVSQLIPIREPGTQSRMQQHETCVQILTSCLAKMDDGISWLKHVKTPADSQGLYLDPAWAGAGFCCRFALPCLAISGLGQRLGRSESSEQESQLGGFVDVVWCPNV